MEKFDFFLTQYLSIAVSVALVVFHLLSSMYVSDRMTENVNQEIYVKESEIISNVEKTYSEDIGSVFNQSIYFRDIADVLNQST